MKAYITLVVEVDYDSAIQEAEVDEYAYSLTGLLVRDRPIPPAGITVEDCYCPEVKFE